MTEEEATELYKDVELTFSSYYKYSFTYTGTAPDGASISASYGGNGNDIYRYEVANNGKVKVGNIRDEWMYVTIHKQGKEIFSFNDY